MRQETLTEKEVLEDLFEICTAPDNVSNLTSKERALNGFPNNQEDLEFYLNQDNIESSESRLMELRRHLLGVKSLHSNISAKANSLLEQLSGLRTQLDDLKD